MAVGVGARTAGSTRRGAAPEDLELRDCIASSAVLILFFYRWWQQWLHPVATNGNLTRYVGATVSGRASAPYQYRFAVPWLQWHLATGLHLPLELAVMVVDVVALVAGWAGMVALLRVCGRQHLVFPATLVVAVLGSGAMWLDKPETFVAFALVSLGAAGMAAGTPIGLSVAGVMAALLVPVRADLTIAMAAAFAWRWWRTRLNRELLVATGILVTGVLGLVAIMRHWPAARYPAGVGVIQIGYNLALPRLLLAATLVAIVSIYAVRLPAAMEGILVWLVAYSAMVFVVGRIDELRLWVPMSGVIAALVTCGWDTGRQLEAAAGEGARGG